MIARRAIPLALAVTAALALGVPATAPALTTLYPGESAPVGAGITTPSLPPRLDLVLLMDTTGSMGGEVANVHGAATLLRHDPRRRAGRELRGRRL